MLRARSINASIAAIEARNVDAQLFAFDIRRQTDEGNHGIGVVQHAFGHGQLHGRWRLPLQAHALVLAAMHQFQAQGRAAPAPV